MLIRKAGLSIIGVAIAFWIIDRITQKISSWLAKLACDDKYMQPVDGVVVEMSCGFNADMYFVVGMFGLILLGVYLARFPDGPREGRPRKWTPKLNSENVIRG